MKKSAFVLVLVLFSTFSLFAQSIQEGVNHLYAERYESAKTTFEKMTTSNPNNAEAAYWLGQTHIGAGNIAAARSVYEKGVAANAPLALVGMGHVELLEGKTAEARQRFETAITTSRGKKGDDPNVLNAIGRANVESKTGDIPYAITKLTAASAVAPNNGDIYINLGNAYRKARDGGQAVTNYSKASQTYPAVASYRTALIYQTQRNWDVFNLHLNKAVAADPRFAPAYNSMYTYQLLYKKDFAAANELAQKYISASDPSVQNDYFKAQASFLQKNYDEAISIGKNILSQVGDQASANLYRLLTYSYLEKADTATAKQYVDLLFLKAKEGALVAQDVTLKADVYSKDYPEQVVQIYLDAATEDTTISNKMAILQEGLEWARKYQRKIPEGDILLAMYNLRPSPNPASLIQVGLPFYQGGNFQRADSIFQQYSKAFPDSLFGYLWSARSLGKIDTAMTTGLAMPQYEQLLRVAEMDKVRLKSSGLEAVGNLAQYYVNIKSDKEKGIYYLNKGLEFDPENAAFKSNVERLQKPPQATQRNKPATATKKPAARKATPKKK